MTEMQGKLLSPLRIGKSMQVRNRVVMAPMNNNYANPDGSISAQYADYFVERARGGVGLIIIAPGYVDRRAKKRAGSLLLDDESFVPALRDFTDRIHAEGCKVLQQLNHNGRLLTASKELNTAGGLCVGPSPVPHLLTGEIPHVLSQEEIGELEELFVRSARVARLAGYDGVEIHGAHGYLINQFLSRYSNKRTDQYGGSLENRMRFALEVVEKVRRAVGEDFVISFRLCAEEYNPDGVNLDEAVVLAKRLEKMGVDMLNVTAGNTESPRTALKMFPPTSVAQGCYSHLSKAIRQSVSIPVSVMGRISSPERAEEMLAAEETDLVTIGRGLVCDAHFVEKYAQGRRAEIRQCIACLQGCYERLAREQPMTCIYNPFVGREGQPIEPAEHPKRVWIVGAGPAGLEAARVAGRRGHQVTLWDANGRLGGQVPLAATPPGKQEFNQIVRYYQAVLDKLPVRIELNHRVTAAEIQTQAPDAVVLATGSRSLTLPLPGLDQNNVVSAREILSGAPCGRQAVVCGGGLVGLETALFLTAQGKQVEVIEMGENLAADAGPMNRTNLLLELEASSIVTHTSTKLTGVEGSCVLAQGPEGELRFFCDTVVLALGARADTALEQELKDTGYSGQIITAGDCVRARRILDAVADGAAAGLNL